LGPKRVGHRLLSFLKTEKPAAMAGFFSFTAELKGGISFLPPIIRIPNPAINHAKIL
jgi:hypothetical protein